MKNPYDISKILEGLDVRQISGLSGAAWEASQIAALSRAGLTGLDAGQMATFSELAAGSYAQSALKEFQRRRQETLDLVNGGQAIRQIEQVMSQIHRQDLEMARTIEGQLKSLMPSYDHFSALTGFANQSIPRYAQDLADQYARFRDFYANAFQGFDQVQQTIDQLDLSNTFVSQLGAGPSIEKLVGASAFMGPLFDTQSFADSVAKQLKAFGWGAQEDLVRSLIGGIDFDALQEMALSAGTLLEQELNAEEIDYPQPPSASDIQSAIEHADLRAVRQAADTMYAEAIRRTSQQKPGKKLNETLLLYVLLPLLYTLINTFVSPLYARWLAQRDAERAQAKTSAAAQQHKPRSRFADTVVVRAESLPIRRGPSTTERVLVEVERGQMLQVLRRKGLWARVRYVDPLHEGVLVTGWIKLKQTQRIEDETMRMIWCAMLEAQNGCEQRDGE